jgi:hypothetical protein
MQLRRMFFIWFAFLMLSQAVFSQSSRIKYNNQDLFLNGSNLAWINFASDIGSNKFDEKTFADILLQIHDNGGNALRWWLHTNGAASPEFDNSGHVISPGVSTISDLKKALNLAWEREVGVILCLWSFDMLRTSNDSAMLARNTSLLIDTTYTREYINNCLIPMIDSLKGHPAIIGWEIFNEPEGMTTLQTWSGVKKISIEYIQRFVNLCAGAIHRTDSTALVTNGSLRVSYITDTTPPALAKVSDVLSQMTEAEKKEMENRFFQKYGFAQSAEQLMAPTASYNYYSDSRLIEAGGDQNGTLDFYEFHFYYDQGINLSPFNRNASVWALDKPAIVGEFHMTPTLGTPTADLYKLIYLNGYAGALAWSWFDNAVSQKTDILAGIKSLWDNYKSDVDVNGIGGDFPTVNITSPADSSKFEEGSEINIVAEAQDADGTIALVEFFANDTLKIGEASSEPYSVVWQNALPGEYRITAIVTDNGGHQRTSSIIKITVGVPDYTKLEAESAQRQGTDISVKSDVSASNGYYVDVKTSTGSITWTFKNYAEAGTYDVIFGFKLAYDTPKEQYIYVNGTNVGKIIFEGETNTWREESFTVDLVKDTNTIQMQFEWGWIQLDYLAVPASIVTSVEDETAGLPDHYSLQQNYPNPFNPSTVINYQIPKFSNVSLKVFDILGREVTTLVNKEQQAGNYSVDFSVINYHLSSGIYFYRLSAGNFTQTKKMILIK